MKSHISALIAASRIAQTFTQMHVHADTFQVGALHV